jgi:hypothetical protein
LVRGRIGISPLAKGGLRGVEPRFWTPNWDVCTQQPQGEGEPDWSPSPALGEGFRVRVKTVCQSIYWKSLLSLRLGCANAQPNNLHFSINRWVFSRFPKGLLSRKTTILPFDDRAQIIVLSVLLTPWLLFSFRENIKKKCSISECLSAPKIHRA